MPRNLVDIKECFNWNCRYSKNNRNSEQPASLEHFREHFLTSTKDLFLSFPDLKKFALLIILVYTPYFVLFLYITVLRCFTDDFILDKFIEDECRKSGVKHSNTICVWGIVYWLPQNTWYEKNKVLKTKDIDWNEYSFTVGIFRSSVDLWWSNMRAYLMRYG